MERQLGGPVWHASAAPLPGYVLDERFLQRCALDALQGVGSVALGQWEEWSGKAYHIRRRLTCEEQKHVGDVLDIRKTAEAAQRRAAVLSYLPAALKDLEE